MQQTNHVNKPCKTTYKVNNSHLLVQVLIKTRSVHTVLQNSAPRSVHEPGAPKSSQRVEPLRLQSWNPFQLGQSSIAPTRSSASSGRTFRSCFSVQTALEGQGCQLKM